MKQQIKEKLEALKKEYDKILLDLQDMEILSNPTLYAQVSKQETKLAPKAKMYQQYLDLIQENKDIEQILKTEKNEEMQKEFKIQHQTNHEKVEELEKSLVDILVEKDPDDEKDAIFEINGAVGGDEANIFASDLF